MNEKVSVKVNNDKLTVSKGTVLSSFVNTDMPCGRHGNCGKCKVYASGKLSDITKKEREFLTADEIKSGMRLACYTSVLGECEIFTLSQSNERIVTDSKKANCNLPIFKEYGAAIDIGTTTVAAVLYDTKGNTVATASALNPQSIYGADVISRIEAALGGKADDIARIIQEKIKELTYELAKAAGISTKSIDGVVITANTVMLYLLTATDTRPLSQFPFELTRRFGEYLNPQDIGLDNLSSDAVCYLPPVISAFIGADTVCALLGVNDSDNFLLADIGTNGEIVLVKDGKKTACSTAAGPAFEGAGIEMGMRAKSGAIDKVYVVNGALFAHVLENAKPQGICGSGLVDAIACLLKTEELDESGYLESDVFIAPPVKITPADIRKLQLAKAAVRAATETLIGEHGISANELDCIYIAGGFGSYLDPDNVMTIGLLPRVAKDKIKFLGNAAIGGASMLLLDKTLIDSMQTIKDSIKTLDLATNPAFTDNYMKYMLF